MNVIYRWQESSLVFLNGGKRKSGKATWESIRMDYNLFQFLKQR
jgi:hypothetical protein